MQLWNVDAAVCRCPATGDHTGDARPQRRPLTARPPPPPTPPIGRSTTGGSHVWRPMVAPPPALGRDVLPARAGPPARQNRTAAVGPTHLPASRGVLASAATAARSRYHRGDQRPRPRHTRSPAGVSATSMPVGGTQAAATTTVGVAEAFRGRSSGRRRSAMAECAVGTAAPQQPTGARVRRGAVSALDQMHGTKGGEGDEGGEGQRMRLWWHEGALRSRILS